MGIIFRLGLFATGLILCIGEDCLNESQMRGDLFLSPSISAGTSKSKSLRWQLFHDRVSAVFLPAAIPAPEPCPYRVEVVHCRSDERRVVREDARLEVARARSDDCHDRWQHGLHTPRRSQSHTACLFERLKTRIWERHYWHSASAHCRSYFA